MAAKEDCVQYLTQRLPFWDRLDGEEKRTVLDNVSQVRYERGTTIHNGEMDCVGLLMVKSGLLRAHLLSEEGREVTLYTLAAGEACVLSASCVLKNITFDIYIEAEEDCEALLIHSCAFSGKVGENVYVENYFQKVANERFSDVMWAFEQILFMSFEKRLAIFLSDETAKNKSDFLKLTHAQVARYVGSAREVVTRALRHLADEGIVALSRGGIKVLDREKLRALL